MSDTQTPEDNGFDPERAKRVQAMADDLWATEKQVAEHAVMERRRQNASWGDVLTDLPTDVSTGVYKAGVSTADLGDRLLGGSGIHDEGLNTTGNGTFVGGMAQGISEFAAGYLAPGGIAGKLGRAYKFGRAGKTALALGAGAVADFTAFDGEGGRLSDLIQRYPVLANPVTKYLQSSPNDSWADKRLKGALEGLGLGVASEALLHSLRGVKAVQAGDTSVAKESADALEELARKNPQFFEGSDTGAYTPQRKTVAEVFPSTVKMPDVPEQSLDTVLPPPVKNPSEAPADAIGRIFPSAKPEPTPLPPPEEPTYRFDPATGQYTGDALKPELHSVVPSEITGDPVPNKDFTLGSENNVLCY